MASKENTEDERRQLDEELHVEILPGTEIMADVGSHHFVKGSHKDVLVPQPSDDPNDPLNWSAWWKTACIVSTAIATFTQGLGPLALSPMFPALMEAFECDLADAIQFTGICILMLGFSNFSDSDDVEETRRNLSAVRPLPRRVAMLRTAVRSLVD